MDWSKAKQNAAAALPEIELVAERLTLRPPKASDWGQWADVRGHNQRRLKPFEPLWARHSTFSG